MQRKYKSLTEQDLLNAGYKKYPPNRLTSAIALYQKRADDYYINAELYDFGKYPDSPYRFSFDWECYFELANGAEFSVNYLEDKNLQDIEQFFADVYQKMGCVSRT